MALLCMLLFGVQAAKAPPTIADVRKAFLENIDRKKNRRVKFVFVQIIGKPQETYPPLNHPDRTEFEVTLFNDKRWREHRSWYRTGKLMRETIGAWDGAKGTYLTKNESPEGFKTTAEINRNEVKNHFELFQIEMNLERYLVERLGIRSSVKESPMGKGLLLLDPIVDDRSDTDELFTLDPEKNLWIVQYEHETRSSRGAPVAPGSSKQRSQVKELLKTANGWYPKRVVSEGFDRTSYYTVVSAEFPPSFSEADFVVSIPNGTPVVDQTERGRYIQGEEPVAAQPSEPGVLDELKHVPGDDWLFYGAFVLGLTALVGTAWYFLHRRHSKETTVR